MTKDRPVLGMMLMLGFCIMAPMGDSIAKILGPTIPLLAIAPGTLRPAGAVSGFRLWCSRRAATSAMSKRVFWLTWVRTLLHIIGVGAMFLSLRYLPLADAVAIAFVMPFIMLLLGKFVLDEEVGAHRLDRLAPSAFIGTLLVIQPSFAEVGWPALLPLVVAVDFALFMLVTRQIAKHIDPVSMQTASGAMAVIMVLLLPSMPGWRRLGHPAMG